MNPFRAEPAAAKLVRADEASEPNSPAAFDAAITTVASDFGHLGRLAAGAALLFFGVLSVLSAAIYATAAYGWLSGFAGLVALGCFVGLAFINSCEFGLSATLIELLDIIRDTPAATSRGLGSFGVYGRPKGAGTYDWRRWMFSGIGAAVIALLFGVPAIGVGLGAIMLGEGVGIGWSMVACGLVLIAQGALVVITVIRIHGAAVGRQ